MTYDRKRMDEAIKKISGSALKPSEIIQGAAGQPKDRASCGTGRTSRSRPPTTSSRNLEKVQNRRKAVIYVSNGYDFNPFEGARYADPNIVGRRTTRRSGTRTSG